MHRRDLTTLTILGLIAPALAQIPGHNTQYMSNGTITIGRDIDGGGSITYLTDGSSVGNVVNNHDSGRQIQSAVFDTTLYNPTQAGDGCNWAATDVWFKKSNDYIYSQSTPVLFYNGGCTSSDPQIPATGSQIHMWSEFLPEDPRAFTVKTLYRSFGSYDHHGIAQGQQVIPVVYQNGLQFTDHLTYRGNRPWTYEPIETVNDTNVHDYFGVQSRMTENWSALVRIIGGDVANPWGVATMSTSCSDSTLFCGPSNSSCPDDGTTSDLQNPCKVDGHLQHFPIDHTPGGPDQLREGRIISFVGNVNDARSFFEQYRRVASGPTPVYTFDADYSEWEANSVPIQTAFESFAQGNAVRMGPVATGSGWLGDLSLLGRSWGVGHYEFKTRLDASTTASTGWWGIAICKAGEQHFEIGDDASGFYEARLEYYDATNTFLSVYRRDQLSYVPLTSALLPGFVRTAWHEIQIDVTDLGTSLQLDVTVQGYPVITGFDNQKAFTNGYVSLVNDPGTRVWFDDFQVTNVTGDGTAPAPVTNFTAAGNGSARQIDLVWTGSTSTDRLWTRIVRKEGSMPSHWRDGQVVYEGKLTAYTDADVGHGHTYNYAAYVCDRAGNWSTAATATASPMTRWIASAGFSSTQGANNWYYKYFASGTYTNMLWNAANSRWSHNGSSGSKCYISATQQSPGAPQMSGRVWKAANAGSARVVGLVKKVATGGDGCRVTVLKKTPGGTTELWQVNIPANSTADWNFDVTTTLAVNDEIIFRQACTGTGSGNTTADLVNWNPTIEFSW